MTGKYISADQARFCQARISLANTSPDVSARQAQFCQFCQAWEAPCARARTHAGSLLAELAELAEPTVICGDASEIMAQLDETLGRTALTWHCRAVVV
jgi:hypothetical protein